MLQKRSFTVTKGIRETINISGTEDYDPLKDTNLGRTITFTYKDVNNSTHTDKWMIAECLDKNIYAIVSLTKYTSIPYGQNSYDPRQDSSYISGGLTNGNGDKSMKISTCPYLSDVEAKGGRNSSGAYSKYSPQSHLYNIPTTLYAPPTYINIEEAAKANKNNLNYYYDAILANKGFDYNNWVVFGNGPASTSQSPGDRYVLDKDGKYVNAVPGSNLCYNGNNYFQVPVFNLDISKVSIDTKGAVTIK